MPVVPGPYDVYQHSTTVKKIIRRALRLIGVVGEGEDPTAGELADALDDLNQLLDSWNTEKLLVWAASRDARTLATGTQDLEIGPGADWDAARPQTIEPGHAYIKSGDQEYKLNILTVERWARITDKTQTGQPRDLYYEPSFPNGTLHLWPKTDQGYDLVLYNWTRLAQVTNAIKTLALPPGYARALSTNLALELAPAYNRSAPAEVVVMAVDAKAWCKRANLKPIDVESDTALVMPDFYDITSGDLIY